jgi:thiamine biosynthesis lipoprotein
MKYFKRIKPGLGTFVEITCSTSNDEIFKRAFSKIQKIHDICSVHSPISELSRLSLTSESEIEISEELYDILTKSVKIMHATSSLFDITLGGKLQKMGVLPVHKGQENRLERGSVEDIKLESGRCLLKKPITLTLDGVAKGYAVDLACESLMMDGVAGGIINAGGDLRIFGDLETPIYRREIDYSLTNIGCFSKISIASSRCSKKVDNDFPGIIISQKKNASVQKEKIWTVLANEAWLADALTKVAVTEDKLEQKNNLIESLGGKLLW